MLFDSQPRRYGKRSMPSTKNCSPQSRSPECSHTGRFVGQRAGPPGTPKVVQELNDRLESISSAIGPDPGEEPAEIPWCPSSIHYSTAVPPGDGVLPLGLCRSKSCAATVSNAFEPKMLSLTGRGICRTGWPHDLRPGKSRSEPNRP